MSTHVDIFEQIKRLPTTAESEAVVTQLAPEAMAYLERNGFAQADVLDKLGLRSGGAA